HRVGELAHHHRAHALGLKVIDRWDEMALPHSVRARLVRQRLRMAPADELVERRAGFDTEDAAEHVQRQPRKLERLERDAEPSYLRDHLLIVLLPVGVASLVVKRAFEIPDAQPAD